MIWRFFLLAALISSCVAENATPENQSQNSQHTINEKSKKKSFSDLLLDLEGNILWEAVTDDWKTRRNEWIKSCESATGVNEKAELLLELEANILWSAVNPDWKNRRDAWSQNVLTTKSDKDLGKYLSELESYILWQAVSDRWKNHRNNWTKDCGKL